MNDIKDKQITITAVNHYMLNSELTVTLNWDANIEAWTTTFKTILMHQGFCEDTIKELFADRNHLILP